MLEEGIEFKRERNFSEIGIEMVSTYGDCKVFET